MIQLTDVHKSFGPKKALTGLTLRVAEGELFAFLGPNGAGKSTTIGVLTGLCHLDSGQARIGDFDILKQPLKVKRLCGLVTQYPNLDAELTVGENMDIHGRLFGLTAQERRARKKEFLHYVELADRENSLVKTLSGGLKRRLMLARALTHHPKVLFLDEPTVGLDPAIRRRVWALIKKINQDKVTIFLTTHYIEEAEFLASRVGFINEGRLVQTGSPQAIMDALGQWAVDIYGEEGLKSRYFQDRDQAANFLKERTQAGAIRRVSLEDAFLGLTGRKVE
ncbi:MAG: ABC transporter ATP-binding protein [Deltaproteobacteria bacterium]|nr:ABC transporter ATP-binding protein [Deltaproteobacteria bacterium]